MRRKFKLDPDELVGRLRIGALNKIFASRYGTGPRDTGWQFPDDDAGLEDLKILIHTYSWSNPLAAPRIIELRAPWADAEAIIEEVRAYPRKFRAATVGKLINYTGTEWRRLRTPTVAPVDMSQEERRNYSRILSNGRRLKKRRGSGMQSREAYLKANNLSRTKPWEAEGISRRTWERRRAKERTKKRIDAGLAEIKLTKDAPDLRQQGWGGPTYWSSMTTEQINEELRLWAVVPSAPFHSPTPSPASPDLCQVAA